MVTGDSTDKERIIYQLKRKKMIEEAVSWPLGSYDSTHKKIEQPNKITIAQLSNGMEVFFEKPGKEIFDDPPNMNDLKPVVGDREKTLTFSEMWSYLARVAQVDYDEFRAVMALIYRVCYLKDHIESEGSYRYAPSGDIAVTIELLDDEIGDLFVYDNENKDRFGLWGMLHMIDVVGWQEDVKYHGPGRIRKSGKKAGLPFEMKTGRENNILSCINVTYAAAKLVKDIKGSIELAKDGKEPDFSIIFDAMQTLMASKGVSPCTQEDLKKLLQDYLLSDEQPKEVRQLTLGPIDKSQGGPIRSPS